MTEIKRSVRKVKIILEYSTADYMAGHTTIDTDKVIMNVFTKDGRRIYHDNIESVTIKAKGEKDAEEK